MRACLVFPVLALLGGGCFNPEDATEESAETDSGSTGTVGNDSSGSGPSGGPTSGSGTTATTMTTAMTTVEPTSDGTGSGNTTTAADDTGETTDSETTDSETTDDTPADCGDGRVNGDEACDDGTNEGDAAGACRPDCGGLVEERLIRLSQDTVPGNFAAGQAEFITAADAACPGGYQAMIADGTGRVGSLAPLMGNGQVDWPIQPWTAYVNAGGDTVWVTTDLRLLGVADDNTWAGLDTQVAPVGNAYTGMLPDFTTAELNCLGFTVNTGMNGDNRASFGNAVATDQSAIGSAAGTGGGCAFARSLYCVEL